MQEQTHHNMGRIVYTKEAGTCLDDGIIEVTLFD